MRIPSPLSLILLAAAVAAPAQAQSFADAEMSGWTSALLIDGGCPGLATATPTTGGHPGAFLQYTQSACGLMLATHFSGFQWDPATQGAITGMTIGYDANWQGGAFSGDTRIGTHAMIRQGGAVFVAMYGEVSGPAWTSFSAALAEADWLRMGSVGTSTPDFSALGGLIEFGLASSNNCPGCGKTLSGGLDNYQVTLDTTAPPVPEPSTWALMALGLAGTAAQSRRRRQPA